MHFCGNLLARTCTDSLVLCHGYNMNVTLLQWLLGDILAASFIAHLSSNPLTAGKADSKFYWKRNACKHHVQCCWRLYKSCLMQQTPQIAPLLKVNYCSTPQGVSDEITVSKTCWLNAPQNACQVRRTFAAFSFSRSPTLPDS